MSLFNKIKITRPKRNKFDLTHEKKLSMVMGDLVPIVCQEILPGDKFRINTEIMMRFAPMIAPVMHRVNVYTHYFFVPNRLVWDEWKDFITGGRLGTSMPVHPYIEVNTANVATRQAFELGTLADYMGLPRVDMGTAVTNPFQFSVLPFRMYQLICDEYYRDQNVTAPFDLPKTSGAVTGASIDAHLTMRKRAWEKDYFTSALPWAQRGNAVTMPVEGTGTVTYFDRSFILNEDGSNPAANEPLVSGGVGLETNINVDGEPVRVENIESVNVDNITSTINDFRTAFRLQEWLEKNARGGARYIEQILSHFGVKSSDARLQRPEYLGGGKQPVVISEVLSTATDEALPQGNMSGHGISVGRANGFSRSFEEHGYVIGIMSVIPKTAYQDKIDKHFTRFDKLDYAWPEFAHLGEQEVKMKELYYDPLGAPADLNETFGYQSRFAEYKYGCSTVHGEFKDSLDYWHMGRKFANKPTLSTEFIESDPTTRIFAVTESEQIYCQLLNRIDAIRPLPYYGTPEL